MIDRYKFIYQILEKPEGYYYLWGGKELGFELIMGPLLSYAIAVVAVEAQIDNTKSQFEEPVTFEKMSQ